MEATLISVLTPVISMVFDDNAIQSDKTFREQRNIKFFGWMVIAGGLLFGVSNIKLFGMRFDQMLVTAGLLMLTRHFGPGLGACAGAIAGIAVSASDTRIFTTYTSLYAVSGIIAGILQKSKFSAAASLLIINLLFHLTAKEINIGWTEVFIAAVLFLLLPDIKEGKLAVIKNKLDGENNDSKKITRIRKELSGKIDDISKALYKLGYSIEKQIKLNEEKTVEESSVIIEQLSSQVCAFCNKSFSCWETKLVYTCKLMWSLAESLQKNNEDSTNKVVQELKRFCIKSDIIADTLTGIIEIKRMEKIWEKAVSESKSVIPEQIFSLSEIISKISSDLFTDEEYYGDEEKRIVSLLRKAGYPAIRSEVKKGPGLRFTAQIHLMNCKGCKNCRKDIENTISKVIGVKMEMDNDDCKMKGRDECLIYMREKESFCVTTGVARTKNSKANVSGDSFTFLKTRDGKYVAAISDGMGSGKEANRLSETAIGLFEQLLDCGLSIRLSLSFVNLMMRVRNSEQYATMDIAAIDLYTGEAEFYKMGAMPTLIVYEKSMELVQVNNLPAGLYRDYNIQADKRKIKDGEFIVMMSDGVYEYFGEDKGEGVIKAVMGGESRNNPQELAERMLEYTCISAGNNPDDKTLLVAKLWKKCG